jgi:hypothetical protein
MADQGALDLGALLKSPCRRCAPVSKIGMMLMVIVSEVSSLPLILAHGLVVMVVTSGY